MALVKLCRGILQLDVRKQSNSAKICMKSICLLLVSATFYFLMHTSGYFYVLHKSLVLHERTSSRQANKAPVSTAIPCSASLSLLSSLNSCHLGGERVE